jgi:hypothetical protein
MDVDIGAPNCYGSNTDILSLFNIERISLYEYPSGKPGNTGYFFQL